MSLQLRRMATLRTMALVMILLMAMLTKACRMMKLVTSTMMRDRLRIGRRMRMMMR